MNIRWKKFGDYAKYDILGATDKKKLIVTGFFDEDKKYHDYLKAEHLELCKEYNLEYDESKVQEEMPKTNPTGVLRIFDRSASSKTKSKMIDLDTAREMFQKALAEQTRTLTQQFEQKMQELEESQEVEEYTDIFEESDHSDDENLFSTEVSETLNTFLSDISLDKKIEEIEEKWSLISVSERRKIFKKKYKDFRKESNKNNKLMKKMGGDSGTKIKFANRIFFMDKNKNIYASAYYFQINFVAEDNNSFYFVEWLIDMNKIISFTEMYKVENTIEFFEKLAAYLEANMVIRYNNNFYLLYEVSFMKNMNIDTLFFSHLDLKLTKKFCTFCIKEAPIKKCSVCESVFYCSLECQKAHWNTHKKYCKKLHTFDKNCGYCIYAKKHKDNILERIEDK